VWKAGGVPGSWTDGQANLGPNGIVYGVSAYGSPFTAKEPLLSYSGFVSAYRVSDGKLLWARNVTNPPNSVPAVGMITGQKKLSLVIPTGYSSSPGELFVYAIDAETGEDQWIFQAPTSIIPGGLGDFSFQAMYQRKLNKIRPIALPNAWGTPMIDGEGAVFVGSELGHFFRLQDLDGNGKISGSQEAQMIATEAGFNGCSSSAVAPGLLATSNFQSLLVWSY